MSRILVVDDEQDVCIVLKMVLENEGGFEVDYYDEPRSALENFRPNIYDLLLLDIKMPEIDGFELYKQMKKMDNKAKVCFLTASELYYDRFRQTQEFAALDKDLFLRKPIRNEELIKKINRRIQSEYE
jgi:CheY-like chemotaxis protein